MTSVGYGDLGPKNIVERLICIFMVMSSGLCWAYVLGEVCAIVADFNAESQIFRKKMHHLNRTDQGPSTAFRLTMPESCSLGFFRLIAGLVLFPDAPNARSAYNGRGPEQSPSQTLAQRAKEHLRRERNRFSFTRSVAL